MKNFKEYILQEDIVNAITNIITKHYKNGNIHATLQNSEIEDALNTWKNSNPNWKEEDIAGLFKEVNGKKVFDKEKIRNKINKVNKLKEVKKAFGGPGKFEALALNNDFKKLKTELEKVKEQYSDNKKVIEAANKLNRIATSFSTAASVMTEDDSEEKLKQDLINAAHDLDEIIKGIRLVGGESGIDKDNAQAAAKQILKALINKLGTNTKFLIPATKFLASAAKNGNAKILTAEELKANFNSALRSMSVIGNVQFTPKEFTSPSFETSLIVCLGMLLLKKLVKSREFTLEGISKESEFSDFQVLNDVSAELNAINIDDKIVNAIGKTEIETSDTFIQAIEKFISKLYKTAEAKREAAQVLNQEGTQSNLTDKETKLKTDNEGTKLKTDNEETKLKTDSPKNNPEDNSHNGIWNPIKELTIKSSKQEVFAAIDEFFGASEKNPGKVFNQVLGHMNKTRADNDKLYKYSKHEEDNQIEEAFGDNLKIGLAKLGNMSPTIGRLRTSSSELNGGKKNGVDLSWEHYVDELERLRKAYKSKAEQIAANFIDRIVSIPKKSDYLVKLKKLSSDFESTMYDVYAKAKKRNSYSELGKIGHDLRNDYHDIKEKAKKKYKESKMGQIEAITKEELNKKLQTLTVKDLEEKIPEDWRDTFAYAIMHQDNPNALRERDVTSSDSKMTVIKSYISALAANKEVFGVADESEAYISMGIFLNKMKNDKELSAWINKYNQDYVSSKNIDLIGPTNVGKFWKKIVADLNDAPDPITIIKQKLGVAEEEAKKRMADAANSGTTGTTRTAQASSIKTEEKVLSFKEYYTINEGFFRKASATTTDDSRAYALLCSLVCISGTPNEKLMALKDAAIKKLADGNKSLQSTDIVKALKIQLNNPALKNYIDAFNKLASRQPTTVNNQPVNNQQVNQNQVVSQNPKPIKLGQQPVVNNTNPNGSVQTSVTTGAVGDYVIPDRLTKQIMRRRIKSFM